MARQGNSSGWGTILGVLFVLFLIGVAIAHPIPAGAVVLVLVAIGTWWYRGQKRQAQEAEAAIRAQYQAEEAERRRREGAAAREIEETRRRWRETPFGEGAFSVTLKLDDESPSGAIVQFLSNLHSFQGTDPADVRALVERAEYIAPQVVAEGIDQASAVRLKRALEGLLGKVKIVEAATRPADGRRQPIPERVRSEVWRRDGGACVDCGSRENLEFDHIVPWSKGGANTARNLELRCETCNRKKAAKI
jgi:HNH endonuclease